MSLGTAIALALVFATVAVVAVLLLLATSRRAGAERIASVRLEEQLRSLRGDLAEYQRRQSLELDRAQLNMGEKLSQASRNVAEVSQQLGSLEQATERLLEVGRSVSGIENLLRAPKLRGVLGETLLGELLRQALPEALFELQYPLSGQERVDAVVRVGDRLLPIDAKFPLENLRRVEKADTDRERESYRRAFARDFKKHVEDISGKYVRPASGTLPLAVLYVPAENVFQQAVLAEAELCDFATSRRVLPVGPLGFYALVQTILVGSRSLAVPESASELLAGVEQVAVELEAIEGELSRLGRHLDHARASLEGVTKKSRRLAEVVARARSALDVRTTSLS